MSPIHVPVLSLEMLEHLAVHGEKNYLDATAGLGGYVGLIAQRLTTGFVIANDRDQDSLEIARRNTSAWAERIRFHHGRFSELQAALSASGVSSVDGLVADLGVSRYQLTDGERGFSLQTDGPLDMRMDRTEDLTAAEMVNYWSEKQIADTIYQFGEERRARRIARAIVRARPIQSTLKLARVVEEAVPRTGRLHPATLTFMALRIAVNREQEELDALLDLAPKLVAPGGTIVIVTFMSLEARKVKHSFQRLAREGRVQLLTKHAVKPTEEEVWNNPPSRSAELRAVRVLPH
jgi:16S rRNA (cytosine1402-N4)-methyltransferase